MVRVKICGITCQEDASFAVTLGVDALGFIFAKSPRQVDLKTARDIIVSLPPFVMSVGVFVNETREKIREITEYCGLDMLQLHGDETPDMCEQFMPRAIKAFQLKDADSLKKIKPYCGNVRALLFDTWSKDKRGGIGRTFDWGLAVKGKDFGVPVILSGGLNPGNIEEAISVVKPFAVDVNSGVEESPGKKDHGLMKELMGNIRKTKI